MKNLFLLLAFCTASSISFGQTSSVPTAILGNLKGEGPWNRSDILVQEFLNVNSEPANAYKVVSFKLNIKLTAGEEKIAFTQGNALTPEMETMLNLIEEGSTVMFEKIIAKRTDGSDETILLAPVTYKLTEKPKPVAKDLEVLKDCKIMLGNIDFTKEFTLEELGKQDIIKVVCLDGVTYPVVSFNVIAAYKVAPPAMCKFIGNTISETGLKMIKSMKSGDRLLFERIIVEVIENGETVKKTIPPLVVTLP
jgi:hypothetical protein